MEQIKHLSEMIEDELRGAREYARCAVKHKDDNPTLAKTFFDLSTDEMRHMTLLHNEVVRMIDQYRKEHGKPPEAMLAVYNYLHERHIEQARKAKACQELYKGT